MGILKVQFNTQTYIEVQIEADHLRDDDACNGGVVLRMTEREAKQLARELADATKRNRKSK